MITWVFWVDDRALLSDYLGVLGGLYGVCKVITWVSWVDDRVLLSDYLDVMGR